MRRTGLLLANSALGASLLVLSAPALAGATASEAMEAGEAEQAKEATAGVTDIIVSAQRRAESLQKVPVTVNVLTGAQIEAQRITSLMSLPARVPAVNATSTGANSNLYIRGVGQNGGQPNNENSAALYIDDIYQSMPAMTSVQFNGVTQLDVLKGPQGTLFGRNATGGLIQITTARPSHEPSLDATIGYGNYDTISGTFYATTGLTENVAANFSAKYEDRRKGYGRNEFTGKRIDGADQLSLRGKVLINLPTTEIELIGWYSRLNAEGPRWRLADINPRSSRYPASVGPLDVYANDINDMRHKVYGGALKISQELGFGDLMSITSYNVVRTKQVLDADQTELPAAANTTLHGGNPFTQEVRLISNSESKLKWQLGAFYMWTDPHIGFFLSGTSTAPAGGFTTSYSKQITESISGYGQVTYPVTETTNVTAGLRYTHDTQKQLDRRATNGLGTITTYPDRKQSLSEWTWRLSVDHQMTDDVLGYISYNRGIKSGGYNLTTLDVPGYGPEKLDAYELGLKTQFLDRRIRLNVSGYYYTYKGIQSQVNLISVGRAFLQNAADAEIFGVDADFQFQVDDAFTLYANGAYNHTRYKDFRNAVGFNIDGTPMGVRNPPETGPFVADFTGNSLPYAPKWTGSLAGEYKVRTASGTFTLNSAANYYGGAFTNANNLARFPSYVDVTAQLMWTSPSNRYEIRLWGSNLANGKTFTYRDVSGAGLIESRALPRTYGVTLGLHL